MCDVKSMSDNGESAVRSMNENVPSNCDIQITQKCLIINECKSVLKSTSEREYYQLFTTLIEETKVEESKRFEEIKVKVSKKFEETKVEESKKFEQTKAEGSKKFEETTSGGFSGKKPINAEERARPENKTHAESFETTAKLSELSEKSAKSKGRKRVFSLIDTLISLIIVGPLAISCWRGIWTWMDLHAELFPDWFCFTCGAALHVTFAFFKDRFHDTFMNEWTKLSAFKRLPYRALRILYTYTFGVACNAHWRGCWIIIEDYFFMHIWITTCLMCLLLACLAILRCIRNLIGPPLIIFTDRPIYTFQFPTRYNVEDSPEIKRKIFYTQKEELQLQDAISYNPISKD
ncbi:uncharacterized protein LOC116844187 [Odontomachus brunneus]|uniref:uncharacterized protein LOC116844187 n=1 Tax=Odontomachus brunneus TaxID=486640 RepID=UPI0013F26D76|nr:uncharacterized protein LOC116844187 [Odontomachus brunneus]